MSNQSKLDLGALSANLNIKGRTYWNKRLNNFEWTNYFQPGLSITDRGQESDFRLFELMAPVDLQEDLFKLTSSAKGQHIILISVLAALMNKLSFKQDVLIFTTTYQEDKSSKGGKIVPFRINELDAFTFAELIRNTQVNLNQDLQHVDYELSRIFSAGEMENDAFIKSGVAFESIHDVDVLRNAEIDLLFSFESKENLRLNLRYDARRFELQYIKQIAGAYWGICRKLLINAHMPIHEIEFLDDQEISQTIDQLSLADKNQHPVPASYHQERLWFIDKFEAGYLYPSKPVYHNIPLVMHFNQHLNTEALSWILQEILKKDSIFFKYAELLNDQIILKPAEDTGSLLHIVDLNGSPKDLENLIAAEFNFDFETVKRLFRITAFQISSKKAVLVIVMHHLIADRFTMKLLAGQIINAYDHFMQTGKVLPIKSAARYEEFCLWQKSMFGSIELGLLSFWKKAIGKNLRALEFPLNRSRAAIHIYKAATVKIAIPEEVLKQVLAFTASHQLSTETFFMGVFKILLHKYALQDEIVIGASIQNREHQLLRDMIGPVSNLIPVKSDVNDELSVLSYLGDLYEAYQESGKYQLMPFDKMVTELAPEKDMSRTALFDVLFQYDDAPVQVSDLNGLQVEIEETNLGYGKYDLNLLIQHNGKIADGIMVYNALYLDELTVKAFMKHFVQLIQNVIKTPQLSIGYLQITEKKERAQLLAGLDNCEVKYPESETIVSLFKKRVLKDPLSIAIEFEEKQMTYQELDRLSNLVANALIATGLTGNAITGILTDRSPDAVIAMLGILKAGGAYLPIDIDFPASRIDYMIKDSGLEFILADRQFKGIIPDHVKVIYLDEIEMKNTDVLSAELRSKPSDLCYVIYTSGTTGHPKGVMIEHRNVVRLMFNESFSFDFNEHDVWTMFHSHCFDFSVWEMYGALLYGGKLIIVPKQTAKDSKIFLRLLKEKGVTILNQTPGAFYNLIAEDELADDDALKIRLVVFGGEALNVRRLHSWYTRHPSVKLVNMYGITETTVHVTYKEISGSEIEANINSIGKPIPTLSVCLLDKYMNLVPLGIAGEIYVGGEGVARGYLNNKPLSDLRFINSPYHQARRLYRSGDLARINNSGEIEYIGRADNQVQLRGFRIELGEISYALQLFAGIKEVHVSLLEVGEDQYLVAYYVADERIDERTLRSHIAELLPDYMHPSYYVELHSFPLTSNGKLDVKLLPKPVVELEADHIAPTGAIEEQLAEIWSSVLGIDKALIGRNRSFFELGGHSLKAVNLINQISKEMGAGLRLKDVFNYPTIRGLGELPEFGTRSQYQGIGKAAKQPYYRLSSAQKRMYLLYQLDRESLAYNMPHLFRLEGAVDLVRLEDAFSRLISRHGILRTVFEQVGEEPVQSVLAPFVFKVSCFTAADQSELAAVSDLFIRPFDLEEGPLLRVGLVCLSAEEHVLMIDMHHIITDGISQEILIREFMALYQGADPALPELQYIDYAEWQYNRLQEHGQEADKAYWLNRFSAELPVLNLPLDEVRPLVKDHKGGSVQFMLTAAESQALKKLADEQGSTVFMVLLCCWNLLLFRLSGQRDIVVGSPAAGRNHAGLEQMAGMFVNTLALRTEIPVEQEIQVYLQQLSTAVLDDFAHQDYQYEELIGALHLERDTSRNPLFDVMFVLQNYEMNELQIPGLTLSPLASPHQLSKFDLLLSCTERSGCLCFDLDYASALFLPASIDRYIGYLRRIIDTLCRNPETIIGDLDILPAVESEQLLNGFNQTERAYPSDGNLISLFEAQVARNPEQRALRFGQEELSYGALNKLSGQVSAYLHRQCGVASGSLVGILLERDSILVPAIYGVLKSGCAYVPIDPHYPVSRMVSILEDSGLKAVLTRGSCIPESLKENPLFRDLFIDLDVVLDDILLEEALSIPVKGSDLAYVIYTSGSTGKPKGVMIEHHSVVNRLLWMQDRYGIGASDLLIQKTPISFDVSVWELFWWSVSGAGLYVPEPGVEKDASALLEVIGREGVTTIHFVPSMLGAFLQMLVQEESPEVALQGLRQVFTSGEALPSVQVSQFRDYIHRYTGSRLINLYGPTEATVDVSYYECDFSVPVPFTIPIGRPIDNTRFYILDPQGKVVPLGVSGELCIAGVGLARGYLGNAGLTDAKFRFSAGIKGERLYHSGDLARWSASGEVEFLGRIDHQVKLRGQRIELEEIGVHLSAHEQIGESVVLLLEQQGEQSLVAYYISSVELGTEELRSFLSGKLPSYMLPSYFIRMDVFPLTGNGKLDRKRLPAPELLTGSGSYVAASGAIEQQLLEIWSEVLKIEASLISIDHSFFDLGGHSLRAMVVLNKVFKQLKVKLPLLEIFTNNTIRSLARLISDTEQSVYRSIPKASKKSYYSTNSAQKSLYFLHEYDREFLAYNMPRIVKISGVVTTEKLVDTLQKLVARHEIFRTSFALVENQPVQLITEKPDFNIPIFTSASIEETSQLLMSLIKPFDLAQAPLIRAGIVKVSDTEHYLMVDTHHIIFDGISNGIMIRDFAALYNNEQLPEIKLHFKDYAEWQQSHIQQKLMQRKKDFWMKEFAEGIPVLNLPTDFTRPVSKSHEGKVIDFKLNEEESGAIRDLAENQKTTLFMVLLSAFSVLLSKVSGQEDLVIGTSTAGRNHEDLNEMIGLFLSTLPLRNKPKADLKFSDFLDIVKHRTLASFEHQSFEFDIALEVAGERRDLSRNALFDVMFMLQNFERSSDIIPDLSFEMINWENAGAKFDLTLTAIEIDKEIALNFEYCTKLFKRETIERYGIWLRNIINQIVINSEIPIADIQLMSEVEKDEVLNQFNSAFVEYHTNETIIDLFEYQVSQRPEAEALTYMDRVFTYHELNERVNRLAHYLIKREVAMEEIVALYLDRSAEMIIAMLAVLKAGGAFLCIDPDQCPSERLKSILTESKVKNVIVAEMHTTDFYGAEALSFAEVEGCTDTFPVNNPKKVIPIYSLAYVTYTSGSTGTPKGVMIEHQSLLDYAMTFSDYFSVTDQDRVLQMASFTFDTAIEEIFPALISGASIVMLSERVFSGNSIADLIYKTNVSILSSTPLVLNELNGFVDYLGSLRIIISGGDLLKASYIDQLFYCCPIYNTYGPSESTVCMTYHPILNLEDAPIIGSPIRNRQVLLVDDHGNLAPVSLKGEICVSGKGLARGYLNDPELSQEKFVENPFSGGVMYRTGDIGRWLEDGRIEFLGRKDNQIKIRGIRIEPAEIEACLNKFPEIKDVLVVKKEYKDFSYLLAYYVANEQISPDDLKFFLSTLLPDYMVPLQYVFIPEMSMTITGKIDRNSLPEPEFDSMEYVAPETPTEEKLVEIWSALLGIEKDEISVTTSFFHIGGHSLNAMAFSSEVYQFYNIKMPLKELFIRPTIRFTADYIDKQMLIDEHPDNQMVVSL
ncbi:non-ribosomal peptide synthetase [Pedobacter steynii]|uniref:Carrier domain-containing protein n=1 Tax=Pedobacter steynii TaxID=430522 RepID=A0A1D7QNE3_9SPHI|nr:non-ribosomal peptide synthetase [Pedobacter steynii]AOM80159.1 hypothetical protein BFS30_25160 [Pedobacter steynii]